MSAPCTNPDLGRNLAAYELGLLSPPERRDLEDHLHTCDACQEDAYATAPAATAMTGAPEAILRRKAAAQVLAARGSQEGFGARLRRFAARLAAPPILVPAGAVAALALFLLLRPADGPSSIANLEPLPWIPLAVRNADAEDAVSRFEWAMARYAAGEHREAARLLEEVLATTPPLAGPKLDQASLYLGVARLQDGDASGALRPLLSAADSPLPVLADRGRWYLAQAHLMLGDIEAARPLLEALAEGSPGYGEGAAEQRRHLEALAR